MNKVFVAKEKYPLLDESIQRELNIASPTAPANMFAKNSFWNTFNSSALFIYLLTPPTKMISLVLMRQSVRFIIEGWCFCILAFVASKIVSSKRACNLNAYYQVFVTFLVIRVE